MFEECEEDCQLVGILCPTKHGRRESGTVGRRYAGGGSVVALIGPLNGASKQQMEQAASKQASTENSLRV